MKEMTTIRVARKPHDCDQGTSRCVGVIGPGTRYAHSVLPPHSEFGNETWWTAKTCAPCAKVCGRPLPEVSDDSR